MRFKAVDEYIANTPEESRALAKQLREIIKAAAPEAEEKISYQMPYYGYYGRLLYFAAYNSYVALYIMSEARETLKKELLPYHSGKATYKFPLNNPLPVALIKKIIQVQMMANKQKGEK